MDRMAVPLVVAKVFPVGKPSPNNHNHPHSGPAISNRRKLVVAARDLV